MPTRVDFSIHFQKSLKKLARKYPSVVPELETLVAELKNDQRLGDQIPNLGYQVYKVRLKNPSASKGKSGGFRVIYYAQVAEQLILIEIYTKSDQTDLSLETIRQLIKDLPPSDDTDDS